MSICLTNCKEQKLSTHFCVFTLTLRDIALGQHVQSWIFPPYAVGATEPHSNNFWQNLMWKAIEPTASVATSHKTVNPYSN